MHSSLHLVRPQQLLHLAPAPQLPLPPLDPLELHIGDNVAELDIRVVQLVLAHIRALMQMLIMRNVFRLIFSLPFFLHIIFDWIRNGISWLGLSEMQRYLTCTVSHVSDCSLIPDFISFILVR